MTEGTNITMAPHHDMLASRRVVDVFIGGLFDRVSRIVFCYRKRFHSNYPQHTTFYFEYDQQKEIVAAVIAARNGHPGEIFNLIGHSWGAVTAIEAANELRNKGIDVDQVITIDPVSRKRTGVTATATTWINVNAAPATSNGWNGDYYATLGGKWNDWPRGKANVHYWAPCHHNEFAGLVEYVALHGKCALDCLAESGKAER
jgi:pimeloyl-ACP methyl ester carboxylesterase